MDMLVILKQVPDLVEELEIGSSGNVIDRDLTRYVVNEADSNALEEAILLKERHGGTVTTLSLDIGEAEDALFTGIAQGADGAIKVTGDFPEELTNHEAARALVEVVKDLGYDLVLIGAQAIDDVDGQIGGLLAMYLGLPYVGVVNQVLVDEGQRLATVTKELPGGMMMRLEMRLPAVVGIQSAEQPPRYVPVSRVRQAMRSATIEERAVAIVPDDGIKVRRIYTPEPTRQAEMLEGSPEEIADALARLLTEKGILR